MSATDELYQQVILDHNRTPRNMRRMEQPTHTARGVNPLCGDEYTVYLAIGANGVIRDASFEGHGCAISKASASLMSLAVIGKRVEEAQALFSAFHALVVGKGEGGPSTELRAGPSTELRAGGQACDLGKLRVFSGVWRYPARVKCAALCWHALKGALDGQPIATTEDKL